MPLCDAYTYCDGDSHCYSYCHSYSYSYSYDDSEDNAHGKAASNTCASAVIAGVNGLFEAGPALVGNTSPWVGKMRCMETYKFRQQTDDKSAFP